ncbi:MAG: translocation/assembly module TamB domain-containing protein [Alphaproteobacteria bacterium]
MRAFIYLLTLAVLLLVAGLDSSTQAQIRLPSIKNKLIELALNQISSPGSFEITTGSIESPGDGVTSLVDVKVSDGERVWLTLERLNFAWAPKMLLSGELAITRLELIGLTVSHPPSKNAEAPELKPMEPSGRGLFDWPRAPLALSIEGVRLERAVIAEGVLAQAIDFDAEGRAFDKGDLQELELSLRRTDGVAGDIALVMRRDFAANTVKLEITASEAPGGMVAAAAGFPADAPARLELKADGPPEDWRLVFDAAADRVFEAQGHATLVYAERLAVDADFSVTPGPELGAKARAIIGDRATLRAQVIQQPGGMIEVISGELTSPALMLKVSGAFAAGEGESDIGVSLVALSPLAVLTKGVEFERFTLDGKVTGPRGALAAEGALGLSGLVTAAADAGRLALDGRVAQTAGGLNFELDGAGEGLRLDKLGPEVIGPATLGVTGVLEGDLVSLTHAVLEARAMRAEASGDYDLAVSSGDISIDFSAPRIAPVAAAYGVAAQGGVSASARVVLAGEEIEATLAAELTGFAMEAMAARRLALGGRVTRAAGRFGFELDGAGEGLVLDQIPVELTRELRLTAGGWMEDETLRLETLRLVAPLLTAETSGAVDLAAETLALDYALSTSDLAPVARAYGAEAAGALDASGRAEGVFAALRVAGRAGLAEARFDGRSYGAVELSHDVELGEAPEGSLSLASEGGALGAAEVATRFRLDGVELTLDDLRARLLGVALSGRAGIDLGTSLIDGAFDLSAADLAPLGDFVGAPLGGAAEGRVTLTPVDGGQSLAADLALTGFATDGAAVAQTNLRLRAADAFGTPHLEAYVEAAGVEVGAGGVVLDALHAKATGPLRQVDFSADAQGSIGVHPLTAALSGRADASGAVVAVTLARAEVTAGPDSARLRQPLELRIGGGLVQATGLDLALPEEAGLTGDAALRPGGFTGDLTLVRLRLALLQRWAVAPVKDGLMELRAVFDTRRGQAGAEVTARARGLRFDWAQAGSSGLDLDLDARWDGARLDAKAELRGDFGDPLRARLALPLRPGRGGVPEVPTGGEIDGAIAWAGDLGDLWALVPAPGHMLDGRADLDLWIGGSPGALRLSGRADLTDGQYQNLDVGMILTDLTIGTTIAGDGTVNVALESTDGANGTVTASAALHLSGAEPALDATVGIDRAVLVRRDDVSARLSGDLALSGPVSDLALTGRMTIDKAEVRLVDATPPGVVDLDGIRIKGAPEQEAGGAGGGALMLDIAIKAERNIFVRGRGLDSEWEMDLTISGDAAAPLVVGGVEKVRGQFNLFGRPFDLVRGQVTFDGGQKIDPLIDVSLELEANGIRGGIVVQGRASAPELRFASIPSLPEDEVLPRLLFGQSKQSLSGAQAIQLAAGVATLLRGNAGPLDFIRGATGVDVLRVEGETDEDASIMIGRNIGKGVFVGARQGIGGQGSEVVIEVEVFDGVIVDTDIDQGGGGNIGISLRRDF